jgi:drug/metabolite transporter (DMT)-like permease
MTSAHGHSSTIGMVLVGLGVLCEVSFIIVSRDISTAWHPLRLSLAVAAASLTASLPLALATGGLEQLASIPAPVWIMAVWYALTSSIVCTALWYVAVPHVPAWMAALSTAAMPVAALTASATLAGEEISSAKLISAALVVAAISLAARLPAKA